MGLLSASLICAVARLTQEKGASASDKERAAVILAVADGRLTEDLKQAFQRDAELFEDVIDLRRQRDAAPDDSSKRRLQRAAIAELKPATDILFEIIDRCFQLIDNGIALYGIGYRAARGDTGAALSAAVAAISSAIFVITLNAKTSKAGWALDAMKRLDSVQTRLAAQQAQIFGLIRQSKDEAFDAIQKSFDGATGSSARLK
jgi:formiminotetrahydrofolate cyclodeaminase